jgi:endonuclease YncB( thermonuclease family)
MSDAGLWRYRAALRRVKDGDTLEVTLDLGFGVVFEKMTIRLLGLNAPEIATQRGREAAAFARAWCQAALSPADAWELRIETVKGDKPDKYGSRWLGRIYTAIGGACLNDDLLAAGLALPWDGQGDKPA